MIVVDGDAIYAAAIQNNPGWAGALSSGGRTFRGRVIQPVRTWGLGNRPVEGRRFRFGRVAGLSIDDLAKTVVPVSGVGGCSGGTLGAVDTQQGRIAIDGSGKRGISGDG